MWLDPRRYRVCVGGAKATEASRVVQVCPRRGRESEVACGRGGGLGHVWPGTRRYRVCVIRGQAQEAVGAATGKGGVNNDGRVGRRAAFNGDNVLGGRVGCRTAFRRGKVCLNWSDQQGFVEGRGGWGSSPRCGRGRALLDP